MDVHTKYVLNTDEIKKQSLCSSVKMAFFLQNKNETKK